MILKSKRKSLTDMAAIALTSNNFKLPSSPILRYAEYAGEIWEIVTCRQSQLPRPDATEDVCQDCLARRSHALMESLAALQSLQIEDAAHAQNCHSCCGFSQPLEFLVNSADIIGRQAYTSIQCKHFYRRIVLVKAIEDKQLAIVKGLEQS